VDIDGDGEIDNVVDDSNLSVDNFYSVLEKEADSGKKGVLYLYLVDHGAYDSFKLTSEDLDGDGNMEVIYANKLKEALDTFQDTTGRKVVVIIEACKSGSFSNILSADNRVVITSSSPTELSYIDRTGGVAFTKFFSEGLLYGKDIKTAYDKALIKLKNSGVIYYNQHPMLKGDNSLFTLKVGGSFVTAGADLITITGYYGKNGENIDLSGSDAIQLFVTIDTPTLIKNVWAVVLPPDYSPPLAGIDNFTTPDLGPYTVELNYNKDNKNYENSFNLNGFNKNGEFNITYYVEDIEGNVVNKNIKVSAYGGEETSINNVTIKQGWSLKALPVKIDGGVNISKFNNDNLSTIWKWEDNGWLIWSPSNSITQIINSYGLNMISSIQAGEGFWVNAVKGVSVDINGNEEYGLEVLNIDSGWNLVGVGKNISVADLSNLGVVKTVWKWSGNNWQIWSPDNEIKNLITKYGLQTISTIEQGEGFWVNK
jgi:hypothetical protein